MKAKKTWYCVKKNPSKDTAPNVNFLIGFGFIPSWPHSQPPPPPSNVVATHVAQNSTLFGGRGGEVSLVLLISLERSQHFWPSLRLYSSNEKRRKVFLECEVIGILKINYCQTFKWALSVEILFVPWLNPVLLRVHLEWLILYIYVSCQIVSQKWFVTSDTLRPFGLASYLPCLETKLALSFSVVFFS